MDLRLGLGFFLSLGCIVLVDEYILMLQSFFFFYSFLAPRLFLLCWIYYIAFSRALVGCTLYKDFDRLFGSQP